MAGEPWDDSYLHGPAPWEIGRPQPAIARLASEGRFIDSVLDAGCGSGEHTLLIASLGLPVLGIDLAETALARARERAAARGLLAEFVAADALELQHLGRTFDTVLDCGLFHALDTGEQALYAASLARVTRPGATLYLLCFSDQGPDIGPHPVSQQKLGAAFHPGSGWQIASIEPDRIHTRFHGENGVSAWLAAIHRI
jgi:SAM-dependent methyltransferase